MRISIALCTFNGERFLGEQLESLARQTRMPDELIVRDDGSQDGVLPIVVRFARRVQFPVHLSINSERLGVTANFARAISECAGDLIFPCDQDDIWEPDKIATLEECFQRHPDVLLASSNLAIATSEGKLTDQTQWQRLGFNPSLQRTFNAGRAFELLLRFNVVTGTAMAFRSSLREWVLPIPESFFHDEWIGLIAAATGKVLSVDKTLVRYRQHAAQAIGPAPAGLLAQYQKARRDLGRSYFVRMVERTASLHERLSSIVGSCDPAKVSIVQEKLAHARVRSRMRDRLLTRWPLAIGEAVRGRYSRFGYGLKSFLQDLVL